MPVRGSSAWQHARIHRKIIINEDESTGQRGEKIYCAWEDCDEDAYHLYKVRVNYGMDGPARYGGQPYNTWYAFCSERHRQYFINSHRDHKNLPSGEKSLLPVVL